MFDLFQELMQDASPKNKGVVISGAIGYGKTAVIEQLIEYSCFGEGVGGLVQTPGRWQALRNLYRDDVGACNPNLKKVNEFTNQMFWFWFRFSANCLKF